MGYEDFVDIFGGYHRIGLVLGIISMYFILRPFLKVNVQNGDIFWVCKNFKYFFGVLDIPDILFELTVDAGPKPTYEDKMGVPHRGSSALQTCFDYGKNHYEP